MHGEDTEVDYNSIKNKNHCWNQYLEREVLETVNIGMGLKINETENTGIKKYECSILFRTFGGKIEHVSVCVNCTRNESLKFIEL